MTHTIKVWVSLQPFESFSPQWLADNTWGGCRAARELLSREGCRLCLHGPGWLPSLVDIIYLLDTIADIGVGLICSSLIKWMARKFSFSPSLLKFTIRFPLVYASKWHVCDKMGSSVWFSRFPTHVKNWEKKPQNTCTKNSHRNIFFVKDLIYLSLGIQNKAEVQQLA